VWYLYQSSQTAATTADNNSTQEELALDEYEANAGAATSSGDGAYLTVPGAVGIGIPSISGLVSGLSSLFSSSTGSD